LGGPVAQLGFLQVEELKERQDHSPEFGKPDGPRFESGRAHHPYRFETVLTSQRRVCELGFSLTERKKNPQTKANYYYLLDDADVKRWHDNVSRGSEVTASIWLRRIGMVHKKFGKSPR